VKRPPAGLARRYAVALLDVATQKGDPAKLREELREATRLLRESKELATALTHPALSTEKKRAVVSALFTEKRASELMRKLLDLLVRRDRVALLPAIEESFAAQWNARRGVITAEAVSATALDAAQSKALGAAIGKTTGLEVDLKSAVDPSLVGGLLVRMGGRTYDGSVRRRLRALRERLVQGTGPA
jgi:F-type H+-transporting ATPase subunit delta